MSKDTTGDLFSLISALTKAEKRFFKVNYSNLSRQKPEKFIRLFDIIDAAESPDDRSLNKYFQKLTTAQRASQKRHLYQKLLESIRNQHNQNIPTIRISEWVDAARILYSKGLYQQSLAILDKALKEAHETEDQVLQLEIIEFEKRIEARHITRSRKIANKVERLIDESTAISEMLSTRIALSNLALQVHGYYIKEGLVKSSIDLKRVKAAFYPILMDYESEELEAMELGYLYQAFMWYYYIQTDLKRVFRYALKWMHVYLDNEILLIKDPEPCLRALHYSVNTCFYFRDAQKLSKYYQFFSRIKKKIGSRGPTTNMLFFIYQTNAHLNLEIVRGRYKNALELESEINSQISDYQSFMDPHRVIIFYYKISWLYFGIGDSQRAIDYLNKILMLKSRFLRSDIESYVSFLQLCCHHQLGNKRLVSSLLNNTRRKFERAGMQGKLTELAFALIATAIKDEEKYRRDLVLASQNPILKNPPRSERHQTVYFNFYFWILSLVDESTIAKVARADYLRRKRTHEHNYEDDHDPDHDLFV